MSVNVFVCVLKTLCVMSVLLYSGGGVCVRQASIAVSVCEGVVRVHAGKSHQRAGRHGDGVGSHVDAVGRHGDRVGRHERDVIRRAPER